MKTKNIPAWNHNNNHPHLNLNNNVDSNNNKSKAKKYNKYNNINKTMNSIVCIKDNKNVKKLMETKKKNMEMRCKKIGATLKRRNNLNNSLAIFAKCQSNSI